MLTNIFTEGIMSYIFSNLTECLHCRKKVQMKRDARLGLEDAKWECPNCGHKFIFRFVADAARQPEAKLSKARQLAYSKPTMCLGCHLIVELTHERGADPDKGAWACPRCGHQYPFLHWKIRKQGFKKAN